MGQIAFDIAEYLLSHRQEIDEFISSHRITIITHGIFYTLCKDEYERQLLVHLRQHLGLKFSPYSSVSEIVNKEFIIKLYGEAFFDHSH